MSARESSPGRPAATDRRMLLAVGLRLAHNVRVRRARLGFPRSGNCHLGEWRRLRALSWSRLSQRVDGAWRAGRRAARVSNVTPVALCRLGLAGLGILGERCGFRPL